MMDPGWTYWILNVKHKTMFVLDGDNYTCYHIHNQARFTLILWILLLFTSFHLHYDRYDIDIFLTTNRLQGCFHIRMLWIICLKVEEKYMVFIKVDKTYWLHSTGLGYHLHLALVCGVWDWRNTEKTPPFIWFDYKLLGRVCVTI